MNTQRPGIRRQLAWAVLLLLALAQPARADVGLPMLFVTLPGMVLALIPIIIIEAVVLSRQMRLELSSAMKAMLWANLLSTFVGIPIAWFFLVLVQMFTGGGAAYGLATPLTRILAVTWQAPWLVPYEGDLFWIIPSAMIVLMVPFFFSSWYMEYRLVVRYLGAYSSLKTAPDQRRIRSATMYANLASYSLLVLFIFSLLVLGLRFGNDLRS